MYNEDYQDILISIFYLLGNSLVIFNDPKNGIFYRNKIKIQIDTLI